MNPFGRSSRVGGVTALAFLAAALFFGSDGFGRAAHQRAIPRVDPRFLRSDPVRRPAETLAYKGSKCSECHDDLAQPEPGTPDHPDHPDYVRTHDEIDLKHGENDRCFNCHHPDTLKRDFFVRHDGTPLEAKDVTQLCAKCHGTHYRDWKAGAHGRRSGYWDSRMGAQTALACTACHDPHWPAFKPLAPAPAPHRPHSSPDRDQGKR